MCEFFIDNDGELIAALVAVGLFFLGGNQWRKQRNKELTVKTKEELNSKKLEALMAVWSLLKFMTLKDNGYNIYVNIPEDSFKNKHQCVQRSQLFFESVSKLFYDDGHGLYISQYYREIRNHLFDCRRHYKFHYDKGMLNAKKGEQPSFIRLDKKGIKRAQLNYDRMNSLLKNAMKEFEKALEV